eukprot:scaffold35443_cov32-Tisochrysis_lutea.AAC.2
MPTARHSASRTNPPTAPRWRPRGIHKRCLARAARCVSYCIADAALMADEMHEGLHSSLTGSNGPERNACCSQAC